MVGFSGGLMVKVVFGEGDTAGAREVALPWAEKAKLMAVLENAIVEILEDGYERVLYYFNYGEVVLRDFF